MSVSPAIRAVWAQLRHPIGAAHDTACLLWPGATNDHGYGLTKRNGENYAHRAAWVEVNGPIPGGMHVCHHCDNPPCIRPAHLFIGTPTDNMRDMAVKGRAGARFNEKSSNFRVPSEVVQQIRSRRATGASLRTVGREFGVTSSYVHWVTKGGGRP